MNNEMGIASIPLLVLLAAVAPANAARTSYTRNVAIVVYDMAEPLDWTGPFEVYNDAAHFGSSRGEDAFNVYLVSKTTEPLNSQGMKVVPQYSIQSAPKPDIVLFPGGPASRITDDPAFFAWAEKASKEAEIAQSVCTGAFVLGKAGLLDGLEVTTHHGSIGRLQKDVPKAQVKTGRRFVDNGHVVTTAGISAGIDGSLHVVARLLGRRIADQVATYMEYAWSPEATLANGYSYFNPSASAAGRRVQSGEMQLEEERFTEAEKTFRAVLAADAGDRDARSDLAQSLIGQKRHAEAASELVRAVDGSKDHAVPYVLYQAAVQYALAGQHDDAMKTLKQSFDAGYPGRASVATEPAFAAMKTDPRMKELLTAAQ